MRALFAKLSSASGRLRAGRLAAACALVGCALGLVWWRTRRPPTLAEAARRAAERANVPEGLVLALAYAETRGQAVVIPTRGGGRGWVRLHDALASQSPVKGAALVGVDVARVRSEPALGLEASARLLAAAPGAPAAERRGDPDAWGEALRYFCGIADPMGGSLYSDGVVRLWRRGFRGVDEQGEAFEAIAAGGEVRAPDVVGVERPPELIGRTGTPYVGASNASHRAPNEPGPRRVTHLVVHTTELPFATTVAYFRSPRTAVGSHYGVRAQDGLAVQFIDEAQVAFHDACFNETTVGIEHEAFSASGRAWLTDELYRASAAIAADVARRHGVPVDREHIVGHGEAPDCSDHSDPGPDWNWDLYMRYVREAFEAAPP